jgi:hypothetical protein
MATRQPPTLQQALFGKGPTEQDPDRHLADGLLHFDAGVGKRVVRAPRPAPSDQILTSGGFR